MPTVGLKPTIPLTLAGQVIEPLVSVPIAAQANPAATAAPLPEDDPQAVRSSACGLRVNPPTRSEEHTSELQSLMRISYAVFCLKKQKKPTRQKITPTDS